MMGARNLAIAVASACLLAGCGDRASAPRPAGPSHQGVMATLPGNRGFLELTTEAGPPVRDGVSEVAFIVYFYGTDGSTALSPAPEQASLNVGGATAIALMPQAKEGDAKGARYASAPGKYPTSFRGVVSASIGGETIEAPVLLR